MTSPITYTDEATGSGTLDGTPFTNKLVEITLAGDTKNIGLFESVPGGDDWLNPCAPSGITCIVGSATATVTVTGVGTDTVPNTVVEVEQSAAEAGFHTDILFTNNPVFGQTFGYALGPIGPTSGPIGFDTMFGNYPTGSGGTFKFTSIGTTTFSATSTTPETPLPAALPFFATGLGALGLLGWRRKRKARLSLLGVA